MLPQILKKSGLDYYVFHRPGDHEKDLPGNGGRVRTEAGFLPLKFHLGMAAGKTGTGSAAGRCYGIEKQEIDFMFFYGVKSWRRSYHSKLKRDISAPGTGRGEAYLFSSPEQYFESLKERAHSLPVVKDDLQHHASGCYSAHWEIKANNRKAEHILINAEKLSAMAYGLLNYPYPRKELQAAWEKVMFNQFHDIMGGCSIKEAYDDARDFHGWAIHTADWALNGAVQKISWAIDTMKEDIQYLSKERDGRFWEQEDKGNPLVVFNPVMGSECTGPD